jgi:hypothetical protein
LSDEERLICRDCGTVTGIPPDNLIEYKGLCPRCVIRQEVSPFLSGPVKTLFDCLMKELELFRRIDLIAQATVENIPDAIRQALGGLIGNDPLIVVQREEVEAKELNKPVLRTKEPKFN